MNYGKKSVREKKKHMLSRRSRIQKKILVLIGAVVLVLAISGVGFAGYTGYKYVKKVIAESPEINELDATPSGYMSTVLDADGNVTAELVSSGSNRVYVSLKGIPENLQHAFVAIEDERFYEHNGVDIKGILRAGTRGILKGRFSEGASTITQQLLKNNVFDGWTTENRQQRIKRKLQEQYLAIQLERKVSKDWILENYLNTINLGQNTLGVQAAARRYFGKDVSELDLAECAAIAAITQNPSRYNPITHPDENDGRRRQVLLNMKNQGYITATEYDKAVEEDVYEKIENVDEQIKTNDSRVTSYFVDALSEQVIQDLQEQLGYSEAQAYKALYSGGLTIYSTQDPQIQEICDRQVNNAENYDADTKVSFSYAISIQQEDGSVEHFSEHSMKTWMQKKNSGYSLNYDSQDEARVDIKKYKNYLLSRGGKVLAESLVFTMQPQTSMTIIDQNSGEVKALVGGRGEKSGSRILNRAVDTTRQPGSTFKILTAYAPALDKEKDTLATAVLDEEIAYNTGKTIRNADGRYRGYTSIRNAIQDSVNVVAVKTLRDIGPQTGLDMAKKFGISTLEKKDATEALALGGVSRGVTNLELTAAYAAIADGGVYREPILYTKITDHKGNVLLEKKGKKRRVIQKSTAYLLTSAMQDVMTKGTGKDAFFSGMAMAGKTGTTGTSSAARDAWFVGYTPYYTCAVWGGYDDNSELTTKKYPKYLWRSVMQELHKNLEDPGFARPADVKRCTVCKTSGKLAIKDICTSVYSEYFIKGTEPTQECDLHETAVICKKSGLLAGEYCPEWEKEERVFVKGSNKEDEKMPDKVCDVHTKKGILDRIIEKVTGKNKKKQEE